MIESDPTDTDSIKIKDAKHLPKTSRRHLDGFIKRQTLIPSRQGDPIIVMKLRGCIDFYRDIKFIKL